MGVGAAEGNGVKAVDARRRIAARAAREIRPGTVVNLGIGVPTLVADFVPDGWGVLFQAENGVLGYGAAPPLGRENGHLTNAGGLPVTETPGASYFDSTVAFGMIRRGCLDMTILGALQVSARGDLANWLVPGRRVPGMGGAMELAQKARTVLALTTHTSKEGEPKIMSECTLPLTAERCVHLIVTELAVIEVAAGGLVLKEVAAGHSADEVAALTAAPLLMPVEPGVF
ncbi:MAG: 3-oxoacid CoA-transferase subunit B [Thermoleophilia bacterium]|nr:3-oxoacid CoA-transferase subunit B [Thermoleophilia bacterium]